MNRKNEKNFFLLKIYSFSTHCYLDQNEEEAEIVKKQGNI